MKKDEKIISRHLLCKDLPDQYLEELKINSEIIFLFLQSFDETCEQNIQFILNAMTIGFSHYFAQVLIANDTDKETLQSQITLLLHGMEKNIWQFYDQIKAED